MSHTPEPWLIAPGQFIVADCLVDDPSTGKIVAEVPCQGANPDDLLLIVQAPAMKEALAALLVEYGHSDALQHGAQSLLDVPCATCSARALLKATE